MIISEISPISEQELLNDLEETQKDISACEMALKFRFTQYNGKSIQERLDTNEKVIQVILEEITRRKNN